MNWDDWMELTPEQRDERLRRYRATIRAESDAARENDYRRMDAAMRAAAPGGTATRGR